MKKYIFVLMIFLMSCSNKNIATNNKNQKKINFSQNISLNQFLIKLNNYANNNPYPKID